MCCLAIRGRRGNSCTYCFHHMRGSVSRDTCCTLVQTFTHERNIVSYCLISQRRSYQFAWPETSHSQIAHPHDGSPWPFCPLHPLPQSLSLALSVWVVSQQFFPSLVSSLVKICFFPRFFVFCRIFLPSFLVRAGIFSSCPLSDAYCCTYREDVRNRLPLCQGQVDFICQVPNFICYQLLII